MIKAQRKIQSSSKLLGGSVAVRKLADIAQPLLPNVPDQSSKADGVRKRATTEFGIRLRRSIRPMGHPILDQRS
ncbi:hypothetical protein MKK75_07420 [Methylobacterium sp. J-030]|uniref:hypothetical protein n=1 Tax=Methylobacterium sp. J-030 TaxID=2836627 RepID=UPI001FBA09EE|nr:hypothetical protein [Methylobacterium sp. J-030]MCJ2068630.1 hypothetical protein [Methylobacterium sp. J-030]